MRRFAVPEAFVIAFGVFALLAMEECRLFSCCAGLAHAAARQENLVSNARRITTGTRKGRSWGTPNPAALLQHNQGVAIMEPAASIPWPIPAHESALLEASGREAI
ncbi:hypothetical protein WAB17_04735 [Parerythrobacter aurantius]|uniref:hypothetical protein n=1 Tax=Parerythrobacter aurantius TaxID=3127706 RepID=UPI00324ED704